MISLKDGGRKIARIKGGPDDGKYVYLHMDKVGTLSSAFFSKHKRETKDNLKKLKNALQDGEIPTDEKGLRLYNDAVADLKMQEQKGVRIRGSGKLIPLPNRNKIEKTYVSAPSGAGKSTFCANWMNEYKKMFKDGELFVFSTVGEDDVIDKLEPIRISLNEELLNDPINPTEIANSLCLFDDVDTIVQPKIRNNICGLRDWLLEQGRHHGIRMLMTSHLLMNYKATRRLLNEATTVVFFPKCGSTMHIKRYLTNYAGFDPEQIKRILRLPSRWVALYTHHPMFVLYEKGAYLINDTDYD